jgi:hypothetical protein
VREATQQVQDGGHGIEAKAGVKLAFAHILNNQGMGINAAQEVTIEATDNRVIGNGETGIFSNEGDIDIHEAIEVVDNAGWGIWAAGGDVSINALLQSAQLSKVNNNGKGGIRADTVIGEGGYPVRYRTAATASRPRLGSNWHLPIFSTIKGWVLMPLKRSPSKALATKLSTTAVMALLS